MAKVNAMGKEDFCKKVGASLNDEVSQATIKQVLDAILKNVGEVVFEGTRITFQGFGSFKLKESKAKVSKKPKTGEEVQVPAKRKVKFKASKELIQEI